MFLAIRRGLCQRVGRLEFLSLLLSCLATGGVVFCVLARFHKRSRELAVEAAVHGVKKDMHARHLAMLDQLAAKETELTKARDLVKLHEAVPSSAAAASALRKEAARGGKPAKAGASAEKPAKREGLELFAMSKPFTDTAFDQLLASTDVVSVEAAPVKGR